MSNNCQEILYLMMIIIMIMETMFEKGHFLSTALVELHGN